MTKLWSMTLTIFLLSSSLVGCGNAGNTGNTGQGTDNSVQSQNYLRHVPSRYNSIVHDFRAYQKDTNENNYRKGFTSNGFNQNQAELLSRAANDIPGVIRTSVVVNGPEAIVGIMTRDHHVGQQVKVIEQQVHSICRATTPSLKIHVTSNPDHFAKLRAMNAAIYHESINRVNNTPVAPNASQGSVATDFSVMLNDLGAGLRTHHR